MDVLRPGQTAYEAHRAPPLARFADARPAAIARCATAEDVAAALRLAHDEGLELSVRAGGHDFEGRSTGPGLVLDVRPMDHVSLDDRTATVGAGVLLGDLYDVLAATGRTLAGGCGTDVGVSGLTLGGGLGLLGRLHGLTCDQVESARVVLWDGTLVEADEDLLWLLRGAGGGRAGVVVEWTFRTLPAPEAVAFRLVWGEDDAEAVLDAWQAWAPEAPRELAASMLLTAPAAVDRPVVAEAFGSMVASEERARTVLSELAVAAGTAPAAVHLEALPYREAKRRLGLLGGEDRPAAGGDEHSRSEYFRDVVPAATLLEELHAERVPGEHRTLDLTPWGGAYGDVPRDATAFAHRDARFLLKHDCTVPHGSSPSSWLDRSWTAAHPYGTGGSYPNFPDPQADDVAFCGANLARVRELTERYASRRPSRDG